MAPVETNYTTESRQTQEGNGAVRSLFPVFRHLDKKRKFYGFLKNIFVRHRIIGVILFPDKKLRKIFYCGALRRRAYAAQEKYGLSSQAASPPGPLMRPQ
ncbi:hypothetical protein [uncultured Dysosmobacter sp.]|uniref:hypothetical protein n=1 Tax=uncultured Dysosmobacter sp. TaxID=2591384 RepID=UPI00261BF03B|nr:hypothetical protein [uncultured Dysosmobacter sp.]